MKETSPQDRFGRSLPGSVIKGKAAPKMKKPLLIVGLPGIGLVSKLTADNLVRTLKAKHLATLYSPYFPNQVVSLPNGRLRPFGLYLYHAKTGGKDFIIAKGDLQPITIEGQYEVSARLLEYFTALGGRTVIAMAGYAVNRKVDKPRLFASATHPKLLAMLSKAGAKNPETAIPIVGMAGLLPGISPLYGAHGACILVETPGPTVDAAGAAHLTEFLSRFTKTKFDTGGLQARAKKANALIEQFEKQARASEATGGVMVGPGPELLKRENVDYIR